MLGAINSGGIDRLAQRPLVVVPMRAMGGGVDDWPSIIGQANALAYMGAVQLLATNGNFAAKSQGVVLSGATIYGGSGVVIDCSLPLAGNPLNSPLVAVPGTLQGSTTCTATAVGSLTITCTSTAGGALVAGARIRVVTVGGFRGQCYTVASVSGAGPFVVTLSRRTRFAFANGSAVDVFAVLPTDIVVDGRGMVMQGTCDRFFEFVAAQRCRFENVRLQNPAASTDIMASFDIAGYANVMENIFADGAGVRNIGLAMESEEFGSVRYCRVRNVAVGYGIGLYDCADTDVTGCEVLDSGIGVALTADGNTLGCLECRVVGGRFIGSTQYGIVIDNGSSECLVSGCDCSYAATNGVIVGGTGAPTANTIADVVAIGCAGSALMVQAGSLQTRVRDMLIGGATAAFAVEIEAECDVEGLTTKADGNLGCLFQNAEIRLSHLNMKNANGLFVYVATGAVVKVENMRGVVQVGASNAIHVDSGVLQISDATITNGAIAIDVAAGATLRRSGRMDLDGCATPIALAVGAFSNAGTVQLSGATPVPVAFPDMKSTDRVTLTPKVRAGTPGADPIVTIAPGVGFSVTGVALDTSTFWYEVRGG